MDTLDGVLPKNSLKIGLLNYRLASFGDLQYQYDQDGFLRQRGNEVFEYNSMGYLVKAYRLDSLYEVSDNYTFYENDSSCMISFCFLCISLA